MPIERVTRTIRLPADLAADVDTAAERCDLSTNRWIVGALRARLESPVVTVSGMVADAHADRYPPVTPPTVGPAAPVHYHRPVGSFDPDTDTPA